MRRTYPAAVIAALMTLVDARQRDAYHDFSTETIRGFGGEYILGRSMDHRTLSVTFIPNAGRKDEIAREIQRTQERIADLKPLAAQKVQGEGDRAERKGAKRSEYKKELKAAEAKLKALVEESENADKGYRDEIDVFETAKDERFTVFKGGAHSDWEEAAAGNALALDDIAGILGLSDGDNEKLVERVKELSRDFMDQVDLLFDIRAAIGISGEGEEVDTLDAVKAFAQKESGTEGDLDALAVLSNRNALRALVNDIREKLALQQGDDVLEALDVLTGGPVLVPVDRGDYQLPPADEDDAVDLDPHDEELPNVDPDDVGEKPANDDAATPPAGAVVEPVGAVVGEPNDGLQESEVGASHEGDDTPAFTDEAIELAAEAAHEANADYCRSIGDDSQVAWADAPQWQKDSAIMGVKVIIANPQVTPEQLHESWLAQKVADGWVYGETKDTEAKAHPCMVPYGDLPEAQRAKDAIFGRTVRHMLGLPELSPEDPKAEPAKATTKKKGAK